MTVFEIDVAFADTPSCVSADLLNRIFTQVVRRVVFDHGPIDLLHLPGWAEWFLSAQRRAASAVPGVTLVAQKRATVDCLNVYVVPQERRNSPCWGKEYLVVYDSRGVVEVRPFGGSELLSCLRQTQHALHRIQEAHW